VSITIGSHVRDGYRLTAETGPCFNPVGEGCLDWVYVTSRGLPSDTRIRRKRPVKRPNLSVGSTDLVKRN